MISGVTIGCILRCIYNCGGRDGHDLLINMASGIARTSPGSLDEDTLEVLASAKFGYFYDNNATTFDDSRSQLWVRLSAYVRGLPEMPPEWFTSHSQLFDIIPHAITSHFIESKQGFLWVGL